MVGYEKNKKNVNFDNVEDEGVIVGYIVGKTMKMLKANRRIAILMVIEIALGMCVLTYSLNLHFSLSKEEKAVRKQKRDLVLEITSKEMADVQEPAFTLQDYEEIQRITDQKAFAYIVIPFFTSINGENYEFSIVLTDFEQLELKDETSYWGRKLVDVMQLELLPFENLQKEKMPETLNSQIWKTDVGEIEMDTCVLLPLSYMQEMMEEIMPAAVHVEWDSKAFDDVDEMKNEVETYLKSMHGEAYAYRIYSPEIELKNNSVDTKNAIQMLQKASILFLLVFAIGMLAIFQLLFERREKDYGISMACGANKRQVFQEIFLEIVILNYVGMLIGVVGGFVGTYNLNLEIMIGNIEARGDWRTILIAHIVCMMITFVVTLTIYLKLKNKKIVMLLNEE